MKKKNVDYMDLILEDYNEPDNFYSFDSEEDDDVIEVEDESSYDEFNTVQEINWEEEEEEEAYEEEIESISKNSKSFKEDSSLFKFFPTVSTWFGRIGIILAVFLIFYFILHGSVKSLLLFFLMLVVSYGLGYICMFFIMQFIEIK